MTNDQTDAQTYKMVDFELQSGLVLPCAQLFYKTYGELNLAKNNVVLLPTFSTCSHHRNERFFGER